MFWLSTIVESGVSSQERSQSDVFCIELRSIRFFRLEVQPVRCFSYRISDMKYINNIKVTEDSVYPHHAENRAVDSRGPYGRRRWTASCHLHFSLGNLNRKSKDPAFYKIIVNGIIIVFSIRQFAQL